MRTPLVSLVAPLLALWLIGIASPECLASAEIGTGPAVGFDFDVVAVPTAAGDEVLFVAWRDAVSEVPSGLLRLDEGAFTPFPTLPTGYLTNLNVGIGGPASDRRAYVTWVGSQLELELAVFDAGGTLLGPARNVSSAVQVSPNRLAGTDTGVLVSHSWDANPYWDPRVVEVDVSGNVLGLDVAENVASPEQTLGTTVVAEPAGKYAVVYTTSDTREVRVRRYGATGPLDPVPVTISGDVISDYVPLSALFLAATVPSTALIAFPYQPAGESPDVRFSLVPLSAGPVTLGPRMSELAPGFLGSVSDITALADVTPHAVVIWQEIEREDPETCGCSVPQPVRVDFFAQILKIGAPITAEAPPALVYRWETGDAIGPPITEPRGIVASDVPGRFTIVWSDQTLRYLTVDGSAVGVEPSVASPTSSLTSRPNPFAARTTIAYSLSRGAPARLSILDVRGRVVRRLIDGMLPQGSAQIPWDGRDGMGRRVPAGVYFARLESRETIETVKLVVVK